MNHPLAIGMLTATRRRAFASMACAGLFLATVGSTLAVGCGKGEVPPARTAGVSPDVASLAIFIPTVSGDSIRSHAVQAITSALSRAGFQVVGEKKEADVVAKIDVMKQKEDSLFQVTVNGKQRVSYHVDVTLALLDRDSNKVDEVAGSYSTDDESASESDIVEMVNKLSGSTRLAGYAKSTKEARRQRAEEQAAAHEKAQEAEAQRAAKARDEKARAEAKERAASTNREAGKLQKEIDAILQRGEEAIAAGKLKQLKSLIGELKGSDPDSARYYAHIHTSYVIENAWFAPETEWPGIVAGAVQSDLVTSGINGGKKLSIAFSAKADHCYTVFMRYKTNTGSETIKELQWTGKGGNTPLQRFYIPSRKASYLRVVGTCATRDVPVTLNAELSFAGTRNAVHYVVVGSSKKKFPLHLATFLHTHMDDPCDTDAWYERWTNPIPGSIVYRGTEPYLLTEPDTPDRASQYWVTMENAAAGSIRVQKKELSSAAPKPIKFSAQFRFVGCSKEQGESPDSIRYARCYKQLSAKYDPLYDAANRATDNAVTLGALAVAKARLSSLDDQFDAEEARQCKPIEAQIKKKWEATFNKIVDHYADSPYRSPIDRAEELASQGRH